MNPLELILKIDFQTDQFNRRLDELYRGMDQLYRGQNLFKSQMDQSNLIRPVSNHIEPGGLIRAENQAGFQDQAIRYAVACLRGMGVRVTEDALNELLSKWKEIEPDLSKFFSDLPQNVDNIIEEIVRKFRMQENPSGPGNIRSGPRGNPNKPETNLFMGPEHADTLIRNAEFLAAEHSAIWEREAENRIALLRRVLDELALLESAHGEEILLQQQTMRDREQALASDRVNFKRAALEDDIIAGTEHAETLIGMAETFAAERFAISERESEKQIALRKRELDEKARLEREHTETVLRPHEAMRRRQEELAREWTSLMQRALAGNLDDWRHWANLVIEIVRDVLLKQIEAQNAASGGGGFLSTIFSGLGLVISGGFGSFFGGGETIGGGTGFLLQGNDFSRHALGFQHGADFIVPGAGGADTVPFNAMLTPGERVQVTPRNQVGAGDGITVNMNFALGVQQTVRAEIVQLLPKIKKTVVDAVRHEALTSTRFKSALS